MAAICRGKPPELNHLPSVLCQHSLKETTHRFIATPVEHSLSRYVTWLHDAQPTRLSQSLDSLHQLD